MIIIKNANLLSMADGEEQRICDISIDNGKFVAIGSANPTKDDTVIDAEGKLVTPGLIDGHCHIGMMEDGVGWAGDDVNEMTDPIVPHVKGLESIKPQDSAFPEAMKAGFTSVVAGPGSGEVIGGTFTALKTVGKTVYDMVIKEEVAMKMALGENPKRCFGSHGKMPGTRMGSAALLREALTKAKRYHDDMAKFKAGVEDAKEPPFDAKLDSLARVFDGMIVKIHAHQQDDIVTAIRISEEFGLNSTIDHCTDGWVIPEVLKEHNKGIIIGPTLHNRSKMEVRNMSFDGGKVYEEYGIPFALMTDHPVIPLKNALAQAGCYVKAGTSHTGILKALSINAAKLTGIADRVGSVEVGKDADLVIWPGDPLHYMTSPDVVMIDGKITFSK